MMSDSPFAPLNSAYKIDDFVATLLADTAPATPVYYAVTLLLSSAANNTCDLSELQSKVQIPGDFAIHFAENLRRNGIWTDAGPTSRWVTASHDETDLLELFLDAYVAVGKLDVTVVDGVRHYGEPRRGLKRLIVKGHKP